MRSQRTGVLWLRASDDKGQDVEGQERDLRAAAARMGVMIPDEYVFRMVDDTAHSVFKGDPPEKKLVLELARRRKFDVLLIWSLDRWSRRRRDGLREVFDVLHPCGVTVFSHEETFLTTEGLPDFIREQIASTLLWLAEEDSKRKSNRVKAKYQTNSNRAEAGGGHAKWGRGRVPTRADLEAVRNLRHLPQRAISAQTGVPKTTVARILAQTSPPEGPPASPQPDTRPNGPIGPTTEP